MFVSARVPSTLTPLRDLLADRVRGRLRRVRVHLPVADGKTLAALYREGEVLSRTQVDGAVEVVARVPASLAGRLSTTRGVRVAAVGNALDPG